MNFDAEFFILQHFLLCWLYAFFLQKLSELFTVPRILGIQFFPHKMPQFKSGRQPVVLSAPGASLGGLYQYRLEEVSSVFKSGRGVCLCKCGNERYLLEAKIPADKVALFGKAGGR